MFESALPQQYTFVSVKNVSRFGLVAFETLTQRKYRVLHCDSARKTGHSIVYLRTFHEIDFNKYFQISETNKQFP